MEWIKDILGITRYRIVSTNRYTGEVLYLGNHSKIVANQVKIAMDNDNHQWSRKVERI